MAGIRNVCATACGAGAPPHVCTAADLLATMLEGKAIPGVGQAFYSTGIAASGGDGGINDCKA